MSSRTHSPLPDYETPPVIEVVIGAQFRPIAGFLPTHHGLFWELVRSEYPKVEAVAPLSPAYEQFGAIPTDDAGIIDLSTVLPMPRLFLIDDSDSWLIQLQPDRLLQNWRKGDSGEPYPRYPAVRHRFDQSLKTLLDFCTRENLPHPEISQLETTYINHIPVGDGWNSPDDAGAVFPDFSWRCGDRFLPAPEAVAWKMAFTMPDHLGRLHVTVRQAVRKSDGANVLLCELTARGRPAETSPREVADWLDLAREWIVRGFADLTSEKMQDIQWGRKA